MRPIDIIITIILLAIIGFAVGYIVKSKKRGEKCIGCPYSKQCGGNCGDNRDAPSKKE